MSATPINDKKQEVFHAEFAHHGTPPIPAYVADPEVEARLVRKVGVNKRVRGIMLMVFAYSLIYD